MNAWGNVPVNSVIPFFFDAFDGGTGASITLTGLALGDILVYKGVSMTQRTSTAGIVLLDTDGIDVDAVTGIHGFSIDTSDNTDAGFYSVGSFFTVVVASVTIDAQTVNFVAGTFRLTPAEAIAGHPKVDVGGWLGTAPATPTVAGVPEVDLTHVAGSTTSVSTLASSVATLLADIGGVATAAADGDPTSTDLLFAYVKQLINILVGSAGVVTFPAAAAPANAVSLAEIIRAIYDDTNELQVDDYPTSIAAVQADTDNIQTRIPAALVSGKMDSVADMTAISGDTTAADNLESEYDGTGYGQVLQRTTIATLASQTSFTLTAGSADNDAYNGCIIVIQDAVTAAQKAVGVILDYTGATKTITLLTDPVVFTMAATDIVTIIADRAIKPTVDNRTLDVSAAGEAGLDWANVGSPTTVVGLSGTTVKTATDVETDTAVIGAAGAGLTAIPWNAAWDAEVESEVDDALGAGTGTALTAIPWNAAWDAEVESEVDDALGAGTGTALTAIPWNAAWDAEVQSEVADALDAAIPGVPTADSINQRVRSMDLLTEAAGAGDLAAILVDTGTTLQAELDGIQADTEDLQARTPAALVGGRTDASVGAIAAGVDLSATMKASVNTEMVDGLNVDTYAEPGQGAPAATASLAAKINHLFKAWRNRHTQDATTYKLYGDDAVTVDAKATVSDAAGVTDVGEVATGP